MKNICRQISILKTLKGQVDFNFEDEAFIVQHQFIDCSFSGIAENCELEKDIFMNCAFSNFQSTGFFIKTVDFNNCCTFNTVIKDSKIVRSLFKDSKLLGASFESCIGNNIHFLNCNIQFADFRNVKLSDTIFKDCNLRGTDFQGADLSGVIFSNCDLRETEFSFANLANTNLSGSQIEGIRADYKNLNGAIVDYSQAAYLGARYLKLKIGS